jgi:hypothetical protein
MLNMSDTTYFRESVDMSMVYFHTKFHILIPVVHQLLDSKLSIELIALSCFTFCEYTEIY